MDPGVSHGRSLRVGPPRCHGVLVPNDRGPTNGPLGGRCRGRVVTEMAWIEAPSLPTGGPRLVLNGFMGTGKSTVGAMVAASLGLPFVDLDRSIVRLERRSI